MAIDVKIGSTPKWNASDYSVAEDATPVDPSDNSGGTSQFTVSLPDTTDAKLARKKVINLSDGSQGTTVGTAREVSGDGSTATITADSRLSLLNVTRTAQPYIGTLSGAFNYYLGLVGITTGIVVDQSITPATRLNLFRNPSGRRGTFGYSALNGVMGQDVGFDTYAVTASSFPAGNVGLLLQQFIVGTDLAPNTTYTVSADVYSGATGSSTALYLTGAVVAQSPSVAAGAGFGHVTLTFTTPASGALNVWVLNSSTIPAGGVVAFRDAKMEPGSTDGPYFDGNTPGSGFTGYYWSGIADQSTSSSEPVRKTFPGWNGNVWDQIKKLMSAQRVEASLVSNNVVLRPLRGRIAQNYRDSTSSWSLSDSNVAQSVEIYYYQNQQKTSGLAYPLGGWTPDVQAYQVDASAVVSFDIPLTPDDDHTLGASLTSIVQPTCVASVDRYYGSSSVYSVAGNDGLPISPAQWAAEGGSVTVAINDDTRSITVTIRGSSNAQYAPYTIGMSSGDNTYYSSLRLVGSGVFYDRRKITFLTGNTVDQAPTVIGATVDNEFISSYEEAFRAGMWSLARWTGPQQTISVSTTGINRRGDTGSTAFMTFGMANTDPDFAGKKNSQINTAYAGLTMAQFSALQIAKVQSNFENQAFGNVAGARVFQDGSWYRIRTVASITPESVNYTAEQDNTLADSNAFYPGKTMGDINALHSGKTFGEFSARPFVVSDPIPVTGEPYPDMFFPDLTTYPA